MKRADETRFMRLALTLARRGFGRTSPNPMVGAVIVNNGNILGRGWHRGAGLPHAEIEALHAARRAGRSTRGATLFVTLEPCCTHGRTPPCTEAIIAAGIRRVVAAAPDPNPRHRGRGFKILRRAGLAVQTGLLADEAARLNEAFNHWIVQRTPFVTIKAAMTLDGKIAAPRGRSRWITGPKARQFAMRTLRAGADAILVGVKTIIADDPRLTLRAPGFVGKSLRRIVLDPSGRMPLTANVLRDAGAARLTTVVVTRSTPKARVATLEKRAGLIIAPSRRGKIDLTWLMRRLGAEDVSSLLVEGGGETVAGFVSARLARRAAFFYAPLVLGGAGAPTAVGGDGILGLEQAAALRETEWRRIGDDLYMTGLLR